MKSALTADETTTQAVPLLDLCRTLQGTSGLREQLVAACARVVDSGRYILGTEVESLEATLACAIDVPHAVGTSSGTDALLLALMALGIGPGDDVLCPAMTFFATAGAIVRVGARPIFVDCCPQCFTMLATSAAERVTPNTCAMVPVHLFGQIAPMPELLALAGKHHLAVIEDAAQALGAPGAGRAGDVACFSFFPSKPLGALGDAGIVTTGDAALARRLRLLRVHGGHPKYVHHMVGGNFRMDALQAAVLRAKWPYLHAAIRARREHAARYDAAWVTGEPDTAATHPGAQAPCCCTSGADACRTQANADIVLAPPIRRDANHIFSQYTVRIGRGRREAVRTSLRHQDIGTEVYYPVPLHLQPCFVHLGGRLGDLPCVEALSRQVLSLPIFAELTPQEVDTVAGAMGQILAA